MPLTRGPVASLRSPSVHRRPPPVHDHHARGDHRAPAGRHRTSRQPGLDRQGRTVSDLAEELGLSVPNIRKTLRNLRGRGLILQRGGQGKTTTYQRTES
ncbi:winged helix-turn-helix domain-containing protein [Frankia sp. AgB32]|uniref:winged helix-turn-helix domain-containing protein n=1 Tax=Frankia sp. AgB32 TaxID=631119 RepID=UPI0020101BCD|nr:winged helix-turn-helix domain-containing protein [Frankia sp. AgB32]MCK9898001.1 winged helix-turn-helix domain-containing protein [Frankia sp. AgB32]